MSTAAPLTATAAKAGAVGTVASPVGRAAPIKKVGHAAPAVSGAKSAPVRAAPVPAKMPARLAPVTPDADGGGNWEEF